MQQHLQAAGYAFVAAAGLSTILFVASVLAGTVVDATLAHEFECPGGGSSWACIIDWIWMSFV